MSEHFEIGRQRALNVIGQRMGNISFGPALGAPLIELDVAERAGYDYGLGGKPRSIPSGTAETTALKKTPGAQEAFFRGFDRGSKERERRRKG